MRCPAGSSRGPTSRSIGSTRRTCAARHLAGTAVCSAGRAGAACAVRCIATASGSTCGRPCERRGTTGWEAVRLARTRRRRPSRRVVLVCDVSRSMRPYATIYLHLMRAAALRQERHSPGGVRVLDVADPAHAGVVASVGGGGAGSGQRQGRRPVRRHAPGPSVGELLAAPHGSALRGAVVIVASDGWDSDPPDVLERAMARVRRRARHGRLAQSAGRTARVRTAGRIDGGRAAVLRSVSARAVADRVCATSSPRGWPGLLLDRAPLHRAERRRSNSARPTEMMPGRIDRNTISRIISSRLFLTNGTLPRK